MTLATNDLTHLKREQRDIHTQRKSSKKIDEAEDLASPREIKKVGSAFPIR